MPGFNPGNPGALGVVCLREHGISDPDLDDLIEARRSVVLLEDEGGTVLPRPEAITLLVNFLAAVRLFAISSDGLTRVNPALLGQG